MGIGRSPRNRKDRRLGDNVVSLRGPGDEFFDLLSPLLEEKATVNDESPRQGQHNFLSLAAENARLRALAVELSNFLGDFPVREWEDAARPYRHKA
jgi:hypothetical protein